MTPVQSVKTCFAKYADFTGRATRSEFWWFQIVMTGFAWFLVFIEKGLDKIIANHYDLLSVAFAIATFIPTVAVLWRRFHDAGRPGWHFLIAFLSMVALIPGLLTAFVFVTPDIVWKSLLGLGFAVMFAAFIYFQLLPLFLPTQKGENQFGSEPPKQPIF